MAQEIKLEIEAKGLRYNVAPWVCDARKLTARFSRDCDCKRGENHSKIICPCYFCGERGHHPDICPKAKPGCKFDDMKEQRWKSAKKIDRQIEKIWESLECIDRLSYTSAYQKLMEPRRNLQDRVDDAHDFFRLIAQILISNNL